MDDSLSDENVAFHHPLFYSKVFGGIARQRKAAQVKEGDNFKRVCTEEYTELSYRLDRSQIQDSCSVRNVLRTRRLANLLISEKGDLNSSYLPKVISHLSHHLYSLGPDRQHDALRQEHILKILRQLQDNKELVRLLKNISKPISHKFAEQIIRDTLQLPTQVMVTDAAAMRASLSALLCYPRQSIGSCFATAPAIIIHNEQPELFLKDINELLSTGRLKRTFGGVEYIVPLSFSWGSGDLKKRFILRRDLTPPSQEVWQSPGLVNALKAVEILDPELSPQKSRHQLKELIGKVIQTWEEPGEVCLVSVEQILRRIMLQFYLLTEQDIQDYFNRPQGMIHSSLLMQVPSSSIGVGGKGQACALFLQQYEIAKNVFKALAENALLKAWEFSLASFCDIKTDFSRWNLYSSLGLGAEEPGGIGRCLYEIIQFRLNQINAKVAEYQVEYEQVFAQVKYIESRVRNASEQELQWLRVEYQSKMHEFYTLEEIRDKTHMKAKSIAGMFETLIDLYLTLFPRYFQEVYDADMHDISHKQYDDSPAGFRLLYKHGRANTSQWTRIYTPNDFIQALVSFFVATENEIASDPNLKGMDEELSDIVTRVVNHVKTTEFLETAFYRMALYHKVPAIKDPLEYLDRIEKKPWAYTSGGNMETLLSCYYKREQKPTEVSRWMESETELLVFLYDILKQLPYKETEEFLKHPEKALLMHSPTHAFLLKPGHAQFRDGWQSDAFTYVWVRDQLILPMKKFVETLRLDEVMMQDVITKLKEKVPHDFRHHFGKVFEHFPAPSMNSVDFRHYLMEKIMNDKGLRLFHSPILVEEEIDSVLFTLLPMFSNHQLVDRVEAIFSQLTSLPLKSRELVKKQIDSKLSGVMIGQVINAKELQDICKAFLCLALDGTSSSINYPQLITLAAQQLGFAMPKPIIFADTNWIRDFFGCTVNPGSGKLELWRFDCLGSSGTAMADWQQWLNGSRREPKWGVYPRYYEYKG